MVEARHVDVISGCCHHNRGPMTWSPSWRVLTALVLAQAVPVALMLPAEHVHSADGEHPSAVVHRHAALHDSHGHADHDHHGIALSDAEDHVTWLPEVFLGQETFAPAAPLATLEAVESIAASIVSTPTRRPARAVQSHGPPRPPQQLRGPPTISV